MKRAVILHAMEQTSTGHWYQWLKSELGRRGYEVWVPDLPTADRPDAAVMTQFLLARKDWDWRDNLIVGHSSGAVEILHLLPKLEQPAGTVVLVGAFDKPLWPEEHAKLFEESIDFSAVKKRAKHIIVVHGDDDPWCPVEGADHLADELDCELVIIHAGGHFSTSLDPKFTRFPELIDVLNQRHLL